MFRPSRETIPRAFSKIVILAPVRKISVLLVVAVALPGLARDGASSAGTLQAIHVSANGHYFVKADGTPFFWLGDTAWSIFNHPTPADVDIYLNDRAAKGFTVIQGCLVLWDGLRHTNCDGELPFINGDPSQVNLAYFKNADAVIDKITAHGLFAAILPVWTKGLSTDPRNAGTLGNPGKMKSYCQFLGARYGARKNIFWVLGGDWPGGYIEPLIDAEAAGLQEGAGTNKILITYHPTGRQSSSFWFQDRSWLDFNAIQSGHFIHTTNFRLVADDFAKIPPKPTLDMEPGYENITDGLVRGGTNAVRLTATDVRRSAYLAVFAGAAGHSYGCGEVYEFWSPGSGRPLPRWAAGLPWRESLKLPGSGQVQYLRYLIESRPMLDRIPDQSLLDEEDLPVLDRIEATRAAKGDYALVYTASGKPFTVRTAALSGKKLAAWWFDPRTGKAKKIGTFDRTDAREFTPPSSGIGNDWVLVLDDAAKKFPVPGRPNR